MGTGAKFGLVLISAVGLIIMVAAMSSGQNQQSAEGERSKCSEALLGANAEATRPGWATASLTKLIGAWMKPTGVGEMYLATRAEGVPLFAFLNSDVRVTVRENDDGRIRRVNVILSTLKPVEIARMIRATAFIASAYTGTKPADTEREVRALVEEPRISKSRLVGVKTLTSDIRVLLEAPADDALLFQVFRYECPPGAVDPFKGP